MEKSKLFKNKTQMIVYTIIFIICLILCIIIGTRDYSKDKEKDNIKFSSLYKDVGEDNVYHFTTASGVLNIINNGSGIILLGFPANKWTSYYAKIINDVAKELKIDTVYYYDFLNDRDNRNGTYETLVNDLSSYTIENDLGKKNIYAPTLIVVKDGNIINYFDDLTFRKGNIEPKEYYTINEENLIKEKLRGSFLEYLE